MSSMPIAGEAEQIAGLKNGLFTSDLSVDEFVVLKQSGFTPLGMVVGSSVYHMGIQIAKWSNSQELETLTKAMHEAREFALARMMEEAAALDADGVVGVDLRIQTYVGGQDVLEFIAIGTAIKYDAAPKSLQLSFANNARVPFSSDLSAQDFVKLWHIGYVPTHLSYGVCVFHVAHQSIRQAMRTTGANVEMEQYTQALYSAREAAVARLQEEGKQWGAEGIVGTRLVVATHVWGEHAIEFLAVGTGIRSHGIAVTALPAPTLTLGLNA